MANTKITTNVIADDAITTAKIADDQITSALVADDIALGGNPTTTTQSAGNNTTRIATTAFVTTALSSISSDSLSDADSDTKIQVEESSDEDVIRFDVGGTEYMTLTSNGKLNVTEIAHISSGSLELGNGDEKQIFDASGATIQFQTADSERMRIDASGNIQIVGGNQMTQGLFFYNGGDGHLLSGIRNKSNSSYNDSGGLEFLTSGTSNAAESVKMSIDTQGNVGIGDTSPSAQLHINTGTATGSGGSADYSSGTNMSLYIENSGSSGYPRIFHKSASSSVASVTNCESGKDMYWGEPTDTGDYYFRGRDVNVPNLYVADDIGHSGDSNTYMSFENDFLGFYTGGTGTLFMNTGKVAVGSTQVNVTDAILTVDGGDMMVHGANNSAGVSDLLSGYTRGDYGVFYSTANTIYFRIGSSYVSYISSNGAYNVSDERLKENVATLTGTLDKVKQLRGVSHTWKDTEEKGTNTVIGMIAQEVETVYPELVGDGGLPNDNEGNAPYKSVNYAHLTSVLVEAVKELSTKLEAAEARIKTLEDA